MSNLQFPISNLPWPARRSQGGQSPISIVLQWRATAPVRRDYTVFVHLVAPDGSVVAQADARPAWVFPWPSDRWQPGQPVLDGHRIWLPPDLPAGRYQVRVGLYDWQTMERLPVVDKAGQPVGDSVTLGDVQSEP